MHRRVLAALMIMMCVLGCSSIVSTCERRVKISSTPSEAEVVIADETGREIFNGKTPASTVLRTGKGYFHGLDYTVVIRKDGFQERKVAINSSVNGWYWGNFVFGGLIGFLIVDPLTGNMWTLRPVDIQTTLEQKAAAAPGDGLTLHVLLLEDVPAHLRERLVPCPE